MDRIDKIMHENKQPNNAYEPYLARAQAALRTSDPEQFAYAMTEAVRLGYHPSHFSSSEKSLFERAGVEVPTLESRVHDLPSVENKSPFRTHDSAFNYDAFGEAIERIGSAVNFQPNNLFIQRTYKERCLVEAGYREAYVGKRKKIPLSQITDMRLNKIFRDRYAQFQKIKQPTGS